MKTPQILAIILNWQKPETTIECVRSLQSMVGPTLDTLVIDNGSGDDSPRLLREALPDITILELSENHGFSVGANMGLKMAINDNYDLCLLINNDAFPARDMLTKMLAELAEDIALLSPKILYESQPDRIWFAGGRQDPNLLELRDRRQGALDGPEWQKSRDVDYLLGTCLLVNLEAAKHVGLLDELFFMYYEDLDWSIRFRKAGYRLRLVADARLFHRIAVSSGGVDSPARRYHMARNSVLFFHRHALEGRPLAIFLFRLGSAARTVTRLLILGHLESAVAYLRGLRDGYKLAIGSHR